MDPIGDRSGEDNGLNYLALGLSFLAFIIIVSLILCVLFKWLRFVEKRSAPPLRDQRLQSVHYRRGMGQSLGGGVCPTQPAIEFRGDPQHSRCNAIALRAQNNDLMAAVPRRIDRSRYLMYE